MREEVLKFYRIEHRDTSRSLWYRPDGVYEPFIEKLTEGNARILPMDFSSDYYDFGTTWFSALYGIDNAHYWFSNLDAYELMRNGYLLYEIYAKNTRPQENEIMFTEEGIMTKKEIPIQSVWDVEKFREVSYDVN